MSIQILGDSAEAVAYQLLCNIADTAGKNLTSEWEDKQEAHDYIINTYIDCLQAVKRSNRPK